MSQKCNKIFSFILFFSDLGVHIDGYMGLAAHSVGVSSKDVTGR